MNYNKETIDAIKEALTPIADKIGQGAEFGWEVVVRQQYIEGITGVILSIFLFVLIVIVGLVLTKIGLKEMKKNNYSGWDIVVVAYWLFGGGFGGLFVITWFYNSMLQLLNPSYYALQFFIGMVK